MVGKVCKVCKNPIPIEGENKIISSIGFKAHYWCNNCTSLLFSDDEDEPKEDDDL